MSDTSASGQTSEDRDSTGGHQLLAEMADDFGGRYRRGERPTIEEYVQKYPGLAEQIRELFPAMAAMEQSGLEPATRPGVAAERVGTTVGRYKLLEQIGGGGMGVVYMAEQLRPVRRKVALKIIKPGMDSGQVIARFEAERQALTMMDHPNIAKVLDAGTTDAGRPYFVMELVKGIPITDYCDQARLSTRQRLELFIQVCHAVQHAHQKGVIHRDLKPGNVLVTLHDDKPVPKVIDFGIAKATGEVLTERTLFTNYAQMLGTPLYMSPEQAQISGTDVDTRSDVYGLGVLLYELLTGTTPFDKKRLREAAYDEMRRIIREEDPPNPSTRLRTMGDSITSISALRHTEPKKLSRLVHGELDWIAMKSLEKDRARRYETANGLARDVERYLHDEPVQACPPSTAYRLKKFIRRNKVVVAAGSAIVAALVAGVVVASIGFFEARRQARIARAGVASADRSFAMMVNAEARGNSPQAERLARESLAICKQLFGDNHPDVCESLHVLAMVLAKSKPQEAISLERQSIAMRRRYLVDPKHPHLAFSLDILAGLLVRQGDVTEAENLYREALPMWRNHYGSDHVYVANTLDHLSALLLVQGKKGEAEDCLRECLGIRRRVAGDKHSSTIKAINSLIDLLKQVGKDAEAEELSRETQEMQTLAIRKPTTKPQLN